MSTDNHTPRTDYLYKLQHPAQAMPDSYQNYVGMVGLCRDLERELAAARSQLAEANANAAAVCAQSGRLQSELDAAYKRADAAEPLAKLWLHRHEQSQLAWDDLRRLMDFLQMHEPDVKTSMQIADCAMDRIRQLQSDLTEALRRSDAAEDRAEENLKMAEKEWIDTAITSLRERLAEANKRADAAEADANRLRLETKPCGDTWLHANAPSGLKASINLGHRPLDSIMQRVLNEIAAIGEARK